MNVLRKTCDNCDRPFYSFGHYRLEHTSRGDNVTLFEFCSWACLRHIIEDNDWMLTYEEGAPR